VSGGTADRPEPEQMWYPAEGRQGQMKLQQELLQKLVNRSILFRAMCKIEM
jgi:hypothetical protein